MNNLTWHAKQAQKQYRRQVRWDRFRDSMSNWFWIAVIIGILVWNHWG